MSVTAVVGGQWGDEGKGRVVDYLAQRADMVIRYQGGDNAGHTVVNDYGTFKLHLIPSGIFNPKTRCVLGTGTAVNPESLIKEMAELRDAGHDLSNLWLSNRAHVVLPYHPQLDALNELAAGKGKMGTTKRGIGPTYADKASRVGLRLGDLLRPDYLRARLEKVVPIKNRLLAFYDQPPIEIEPLYEQCLAWGRELGPMIVDVLPMTQEAVRGGHKVLLEGQLGVMRDLDWGIYPYVTSSFPATGGACSGAGIPPSAINEVIGVVKAYSTAVGAGPFPVELFDDNGEELRKVGHEYGATTGRPRRCGWFDGVAIKYAMWLNGVTHMAVTKLDVLDDFDEIKLCVAYELDGERVEHFPETADLERVKPIYETMPGWNSSTRDVRTWEDLPKAARQYLHRLAELAGAPIRYVSVGPERPQLVVVDTFGVETLGETR